MLLRVVPNLATQKENHAIYGEVGIQKKLPMMSSLDFIWGGLCAVGVIW